MKLQEIAEQLRLFGLADDEAQVFVQLTMLGPSKASDAAKAAGLPRARVYRVLDSLTKRGFVSTTLTRPTQFQAASPARLFEQAFAAHEGKWELLQKTRSEIEDALAGLRPASNGTAGVRFRTINGRTESFQEMLRMIGAATSSLHLASFPATLPGAPELSEVLELCVRRAMQGLRVELALPSAVAEASRVPFLGDPRVRTILRDDAPAMRFLVADQREALLWMNVDASSRRGAEGDACLWTDGSLVVGALVASFASLPGVAQRTVSA